MGGAHRSVPSWVSAVPIRCRNHCRRHSPDASLLAVDVSASAAAGRHDGERLDGCADSARWRGAATHAGRSAHTLPHNKCCRDRSGCRSAPAPHNAGSCRADNSARPAPAMPLPKHWTVLGQGRHKGPAQLPFPGTAHRGLGGSDANLETLGPRFFDLSARAYRRGCSTPRHRQINNKIFCRRWRQIALFRNQGKRIGDPNGHRSNQSATNCSRQPTTQIRTHRQKSAGLNSHQHQRNISQSTRLRKAASR